MEIKVTSSDLFSITQAAKKLGRPRKTIYQWLANGKMHGIKLGEFTYIPVSEITRLDPKKQE